MMMPFNWTTRRVTGEWFSLFVVALSLLLSMAGMTSPAHGEDAPWARWHVESPGRAVTRQNGFIRVDYQSPKHEAVTLTPTHPISLPADATRIGVWYGAAAGDVKIAFVVRDAAGKKHVLSWARASTLADHAWAIDYDGKRRGDWPRWTRCESTWLREPTDAQVRERMPGEAVQRVMAMRWPMPLTLTGLRIEPRANHDGGWRGAYTLAQRDAIDQGIGSIWLTGLRIYTKDSFHSDFYAEIKDRFRWARGESQVLFPDDLVRTSGRDKIQGAIRYAIQIHDGYQGPVIWRDTGKVKVDEDKPIDLFENRIALPRVAPGRYFIRTKAWGPKGALAAERRLQWFVGEGPDAHLKAVALPMSITTGEPNEVYPSTTTGATLKLHVAPSVWSSAGEGAVGQLTVIDWRGRMIFKQELKREDDQTVSCPVQAGNDYFATLEIRRDKTICDRAHLQFGVANAAADPAPLPSTVKSLNQLLNGQAQLHPEYRVGRMTSATYPWVNVLSLEDFSKWLDDVDELGAGNAPVISFKAIWPDIEALPGVYRWKVLDQRVSLAAKHRKKVIFGYTPTAGWVQPWWLDWSPMRDQHGNFQGRLWSPSHWDAPTNQGRDDFLKHLAEHFRGNAAVAGYRIHARPLPGHAAPDPRNTDYARPTQQAFARWLKQEGRKPHPMPQVFWVPGTNLPQLPPDLSKVWRDFADFNTYTIRATIRRLMGDIRGIDAKRPILVDHKNMPWAIETALPLLAKDGNAAIKAEGSPRLGDVALRSMGASLGVSNLSELHRHMPTSLGIADATNYWSSLYSNRILWLLRWRPDEVAHPSNLWRDVPKVMQFLARTQENWDALMRLPRRRPKVLVFGSRTADLVGGPRRGYYNDISGMRTFESLVRWRQVSAAMADEYTDWVDLSQYDLVLACGEVVTPHAIDRLKAYAQQGGRLVLVGDVGRYTQGQPDHRNLLEQALAGLPNVKRIDAPHRMKVPRNASRGDSWAVPWVLDSSQLEDVLAWAGVHRPMRVETNDPLGFECQLRIAPNGKTAYATVMRNWFGWYRGHIELEDGLRRQFGEAGGTVHIRGLQVGGWHVEKLHRRHKDLGVIHTQEDELRFALDPAQAAEVEMYRLTRQEAP